MLKLKNRIVFFLFLILFFCLSIGFMSMEGFFCRKMEIAYAEESIMNIEGKSYEFEDGTGYNFEELLPVSKMTYGTKSLGTFSISGEITDVSTYRKMPAYGVSGNIHFSYSYNGWLQNRKKEQWNLNNDTANSINGEILSGSIGFGTVLVQMSSDGSVYSNLHPVTNCFNNLSELSDFYTTNGIDVAQGKYYRIIFAYETRIKVGETANFPDFWNKTEQFNYKNHAEVYEFYVCRNDGIISLHNLAVKEDSIVEEGVSSEILLRGETLIDGSTTTRGFEIDKLGTSYFVSVYKNGIKLVSNANDGQQFTENGKYKITAITKLGKQVTTNICVFNGGEDKGFSSYFNNYIVEGNRVYRNKDYPIFDKDSKIKVIKRDQYIPQLYGKIINQTTTEEFSFTETLESETISLTAGVYIGSFYAGNPNIAGSVYQYNFNFEIINEKSAPYINYYNLTHSDNLEDLAAKHFEVAYPTTKGGYVFVCFSSDSYTDACNYAYEIEKRYIEKRPDGLYYKSEDNPNEKVKYIDNIKLTELLNKYASSNVVINYFNAKDEFTYRTLSNNSLSELEALNVDESVRVFPSQEEKEKVFARKPFINNFSFLQVADFDSVSITAYCYKNGINYQLAYNKPISEQLTISSMYKIIEKNVYGDEKEYEVCFMCENLTQSCWEITNNGNVEIENITLSSSINNPIITADSVLIKTISNEFDDNAIVSIKASNVYSFEIKCLISELKNIELYKKGIYELQFIDRIGNSYKVYFNLTGNTKFTSLKENSKCYTAMYNTVNLQAKSFDEEIIIDSAELNALLNMVFDENSYTTSSYNTYKHAFNDANSVYNNNYATQAEINDVGIKLKNAISMLIPIKTKSELYDELQKYETINDTLYTSSSLSNYSSIYYNAKTVYLDDNASKDDISEAVYNMKKAYDSLIFRGDKTLLKEKLIEAQNIYCEKYTPQSVEQLEETFNRAYVIYTETYPAQSVIDAMINEITSQINALVLRADFSELEAILRIIKQLNPNSYSHDSITNLHIQYKNAVLVYNNKNSTQLQIDTEISKLQYAYSNLIEIGDKRDLAHLAADVKNMKLFLYTKATALKVEEMYKNAILVLDEEMATSTEIDIAFNSLYTAKNNLIKVQYKEDLYKYLQELEGKDLSKYSKDSVNKLQEQYNNGYTVLYNYDATEQEISQVKMDIQKAQESLTTNTRTWWEIVLVSIISLIVYLIITLKLDIDVFMWDNIVVRVINGVASVLVITLLFIFTSIAWWLILIISVALLCLIGLGLGAIAEEYWY